MDAPCSLSVLSSKVMDGNVITAKRTAAVSAIATKVSLVPGRLGWAGGESGAGASSLRAEGEVGDLP